MNQLIWFSIPGAYIVGALYGWIDIPGEKEHQIEVLLHIGTLGLAIFFGFVTHQAYRAWFENCGGSWWNRDREVIDAICTTYDLDPTDTTQRHTAFLVWEMSLYSELMPEAFRSHNRSSWHYVMSFASCQFAAALCLASHIFRHCNFLKNKSDVILVIISVISFAIFHFKRISTLKEIHCQEKRAFDLYRWIFDAVRRNRIRPLVDEKLK